MENNEQHNRRHKTASHIKKTFAYCIHPLKPSVILKGRFAKISMHEN